MHHQHIFTSNRFLTDYDIMLSKQDPKCDKHKGTVKRWTTTCRSGGRLIGTSDRKPEVLTGVRVILVVNALFPTGNYIWVLILFDLMKLQHKALVALMNYNLLVFTFARKRGNEIEVVMFCFMKHYLGDSPVIAQGRMTGQEHLGANFIKEHLHHEGRLFFSFIEKTIYKRINYNKSINQIICISKHILVENIRTCF
ncbi:hypothetical protein ACJX0J_026611 [Zea mays]